MEGARSATTADLAEVAALAEWAIEELREHRGGSIWSRREARPTPVGERVAFEMDADDHHIVVGTIDEVIVGYGAVRLAPLHDGENLGVIDDLYVLPDGRGVGVGEAMMDLLVTWCTERACVGVDAVALPGDRETKNFFETFGLKARAITVHRRLS